MARFETISFICFISLHLKSSAGSKLGIYDKQLYRVIPQYDYQLVGLYENILRHKDVVLWNGIGGVGNPLEFLATDKAMETFSTESLSPLGLTSEVVFPYVDIVMSTKIQDIPECECEVIIVPAETYGGSTDSSPDKVDYNSHDLAPTRVPIQRIPKTSLFTGIYFKLFMKRFPSGLVSWTDVTNRQGSNYIEIDMNPGNLLHYREGEKWDNDTQWMFRPTEYPNWYTWENRVLSNAIITWSFEEVGGGYHIIASRVADDTARYGVGGRWRDHALWKPVPVEGNDNYYKIVNRNFPDGTITYTEKKYGDYSHYIQVDIKPENVPHYQHDGKWLDDSLFLFGLRDPN